MCNFDTSLKKIQFCTIQSLTQNQINAIIFMLTLVPRHLSSKESNSRAIINMNAKLLTFTIQVKAISFTKFSNLHYCTFLLRKLSSLGISKRNWNSNVDNVLFASCDWLIVSYELFPKANLLSTSTNYKSCLV